MIRTLVASTLVWIAVTGCGPTAGDTAKSRPAVTSIQPGTARYLVGAGKVSLYFGTVAAIQAVKGIETGAVKATSQAFDRWRFNKGRLVPGHHAIDLSVPSPDIEFMSMTRRRDPRLGIRGTSVFPYNLSPGKGIEGSLALWVDANGKLTKASYDVNYHGQHPLEPTLGLAFQTAGVSKIMEEVL